MGAGRDEGRALSVTEGGVTSNGLYDGLTVVADGATQLTTAPNGQVLTETTTTTTTEGQDDHDVGGVGGCPDGRAGQRRSRPPRMG